MANNFQVTAGAGTNVATTQDASLVHHPRQVLELDNAGAPVTVSSTNPIPITLANTGANATAVKVDNSAVTQPISAASLPLPTGAAQDATLTGGSLKAQGNVASGATDAGNPVKVGGVFNSVAPTLTTGQRGDLQLGSSGLLKVDASGASVPVTGTFYQATQPISGTVTSNIGTTNGLALDATLTGGSAKTQGNVASAAADSGNPVKTGGVFNTTQPTVTTGQRVDAQATARGAMIVAPGVDNFAVQATLQAAENHVGLVGGVNASIQVTPTIQAAAYAAGASIGGIATIAGATRVTAGSGLINSVSVFDKGHNAAPIEVIFWAANPGTSTFTDKTAVSIASTDSAAYLGHMRLTDYITHGASVGITKDAPIAFKLPSGTSLYMTPVYINATTPLSTSDLVFTVNLVQD